MFSRNVAINIYDAEGETFIKLNEGSTINDASINVNYMPKEKAFIQQSFRSCSM